MTTDLLGEEQDVPILAPVFRREIVYRLPVGDRGTRLRQIAWVGSRGNQIARAIGRLKENFKRPLRVEDLASEVGMSSSTFHQHFRWMTALSPLQLQKQLRLREARRLFLIEDPGASAAAFQTGYESPSEFSRECHRQSRESPARAIRALRQVPVAGAC